MPIYEYRCDSCSHELEKLQNMSEDMLVDCPVCEQPTLKRLISAAAFRLKGSGWYETDFKKDNKRNLAESSTTESTDKKPATNGSEKPDTSAKADGAKTPGKQSSDQPAKKPSKTQGPKHA